MYKSVSIIGNDKTIIEKSKQIIDSKKYNLKYIMYYNINYDLLSQIDCIYIDDNLSQNIKEEILNYCIDENKELYVFPSIIQIFEKSKYHTLHDSLVFKVSDYKLSLYQKFIKRLLDIFISLIVIILISPLMMIIYILIKIFDPGPCIYLQKRLTRDKNTFILYKFRTMINKAELKSGAVLSSANDNRITSIGKFLRKTRLDELPQIFNVLFGSMSIVGPRPERECFVSQFCEENSFYKYRFKVKAGITGLSQINCRYCTKYDDKLKYDLLYIGRYNLYTDIIIILKTIKIIFDKSASEGTKDESIKESLEKNNLEINEIESGILELRRKR